MHFNDHYNLLGKHALLSPSSPNWLRYTPDKFRSFYLGYLAKIRGTKLHDFAKDAIRLGIRMPNDNNSFNRYINDAIDMNLRTEQPLYYSDNCFGTSDAIGIVDGVLHVHDLKTGDHPVKFDQLLVYASLFFLEYASHMGISVENTPVELRIYQSGEVRIDRPSLQDIRNTMTIIIQADQIINNLRGGNEW